MIASANRPCVDDIADKDSSVANLTRMGYTQYHLNGRFQQHVAAYNGDGYTLNDIGTILDSTIKNQSMSELSKARFTSSNFVLRIIASIFFIP